MGNPELVVKSPEEDEVGILHRVLEHAEQLFVQQFLLNAVVVVQTGLCAPADVQGGMGVGLAPLHDLAQLGPIVHLFEVHQLHRRTGDDHTVKGAVLHLIKGLVKGQHMLLGGVFGHVSGGGDQLQLDLQGRVAEQARELGLSLDLFGHQIQKQNQKLL